MVLGLLDDKGLTNQFKIHRLSKFMDGTWVGQGTLEPEVVGTVVVPDLVSKGKDTL